MVVALLLKEVGKVARKTLKEKATDRAFQVWYEKQAKKIGINPDPDHPRQRYDYRRAYRAGVKGPGKGGHWPSAFKKKGHPRLVVDGINTKTGQKVN